MRRDRTRLSAVTGFATARRNLQDPDASRFVDEDLNRVTVRLTPTVIAKSPPFRFAAQFGGLEVIANAGEPIAYDDGVTVTAP